MLRDVIASHPLLFCPNETHFFRYADPFGTLPYARPFLNAKLFEEHRRLDNISEEMFRQKIYPGAKTRRELMERYGEAYLKAQNAPPGSRWFDKTPQHAFGAFLLAHQFPTAQFIHIVRHPLNVIASLRTSKKVMHIEKAIPAANYWYESLTMMKALKSSVPDRFFEIRYDTFTENPQSSIAEIFDFIDEDPDQLTFHLRDIHREKNKFTKVLETEDISIARGICGELAKEYGFEF